MSKIIQLPNWFEWMSPNFDKHLSEYKGQKVDFLQIGTFSGDASLWLLENILTNPDSRLFDVDTWEGSVEHISMDFTFKDIEQAYDDKMLPFSNVIKKKMTSDVFFEQNTEKFDFIYIDGAHTYDQIIKDAENALKFSKVGTIIGFDDYNWDISRDPELAINKFLEKYNSQVELLTKNYQVWVRITRL